MINRKFLTVKKIISNTLPYLGAGIIVFVYGGTAAFMSYLLSLRMDGHIWLASTVGFGVALTRMFIVFQSQMGVTQIAKKFDMGAVMALALTVYTVVECWVLKPDIALSISGLIISGLIVEVIYLSRLNEATRHEIFTSQKKVKDLVNLRKSEAKFFRMMEDLELEIEDEETSSSSKNGVAVN